MGLDGEEGICSLLPLLGKGGESAFTKALAEGAVALYFPKLGEGRGEGLQWLPTFPAGPGWWEKLLLAIDPEFA